MEDEKVQNETDRKYILRAKPNGMVVSAVYKHEFNGIELVEFNCLKSGARAYTKSEAEYRADLFGLVIEEK